MKNYIFKKYAICSFFVLILLTFLYSSINYNSINILKDINIYGKETENIEENVQKKSEKKTEESEEVKTEENAENNNENNSKNVSDDKSKQSSTKTTTESTGDEMVKLLARLINGEARGEPYEGQVAVGAVILNRVKSPKFPNTIASVIYQNGQFTCVRDGQFNEPIDENSTVYKAATEAMNGADPTNGALYFYNPSKTQSKWLFSLKTTTTIGKHRFALGE